MFRPIVLFFLFAVCVFADHEFRVKNNCQEDIWVKFIGNPGKPVPENGNYKLNKGATHSFHMVPDWAGRVWAQSDCDATGHCGPGPNTLTEFTLGDMDYYDVSLVDGYNLQAKIVPIPGTYKKTGNAKYDCNVAGCNSDLNAICPPELAIKKNGKTIVCRSACATFKTDEYCCGGAHDKPETCKSKDWPKNYPAIFKKACPDAYSYAYDDASSTFTCHPSGNKNTGYEIIFC